MGPEADSKETLRQLPLADTLAAFYTSEKFLKLRALTQSAYKDDLKGLQESLKRYGIESTSQITSQTISNHLESFQRSPATFARHRASTITFLEWAGAEQLVDRSLVDGLPERLKRGKRLPLPYISDEEIAKLLEKASGNLRSLALVTLTIKTGARPSEILGLNVDDIESISSTQISIQFTNGAGKRINFLEGESAEILRRQTAEEQSGPLFRSVNGPTIGARLHRQSFQSAVRELGRSIGQPDLNPRTLRNTFVRNFEGNPAQLAAELGIGYDNASIFLADARK